MLSQKKTVKGYGAEFLGCLRLHAGANLDLQKDALKRAASRMSSAEKPNRSGLDRAICCTKATCLSSSAVAQDPGEPGGSPSIVEHAEKVMQEEFAVGVGGSYGCGDMTCRGGKDFKGPWGAPTMMAKAEALACSSVVMQPTSFMLFMSPRSATSILSSKVKQGGYASAAAGPVGRRHLRKLM